MATPLDLPLPEITVENFQCAWTCFKLVANAKDWNDGKRKVVLPTLLRDKLFDIYTLLDEETQGDLHWLKKALRVIKRSSDCWPIVYVPLSEAWRKSC